MALFSIFSDSTDPNDFKAVVGGAVNESFLLLYIEPYFDNTHQQRMEEWLGNDLYVALKEALEGTPDAAEAALLPFYRKPLAWLTLHDYLPFAEAQITGSGVSRVENDNYKGAYKDQIRKIQAQCILNGYEAMERLIIFLDARRSDYPGWELTPGYLKYHSVLLNTALAFRSVYDKSITRQVFDESLFGCIQDAEAFSLTKILGQAQYDALLAARRDGSWTTEAKEKKAILFCQKISAHFALREALARNFVRLDGNRVVQIEYLVEQAAQREGTASNMGLGLRMNHHDERANAYIKSLRDYLAAQIEDPAFADYKAWQATLAEEEAAYQATQETTDTCDKSERGDFNNAFFFGGTGNGRRGVGRL